MGLAKFIAAASRRWPKFPFRAADLSRSATAPHLVLGRRGEELAAAYLRDHQQFKVLYRNFRGGRGGEIDLVCRDIPEDTLVFVEVKTRSSELFGSPRAAVNKTKQLRIVRGGMAWLRMLDRTDVAFRFDIVEVVMTSPPEIRLLRDAFQLPTNWYY